MSDVIDGFADWQWNVNAWSKQDNPAAAVNHFLAYRRLGIVDSGQRAFNWLCYGQRDNAEALAAYRSFHDVHGDAALFAAVLRAHGGVRPDAGEAAVHLEWQMHNHPFSLVAALQAWQDGTDEPVEAMFRLLEGQGHNHKAAQLYRACFASDITWLFDTVEAHVRKFALNGHEHPYLNGELPAAYVFRDEVPSGERGEKS